MLKKGLKRLKKERKKKTYKNVMAGNRTLDQGAKNLKQNAYPTDPPGTSYYSRDEMLHLCCDMELRVNLTF